MKKILMLIMVLSICMVPMLVMAGDNAGGADQAVKDAWAKKAAGDYLGAAMLHPNTLCGAMYMWNHACSLIGVRDANGNWAFTPKKADKITEALAALDKAEVMMNDALAEDPPKTCKGVDADNLKTLINRVRATLQDFTDGK